MPFAVVDFNSNSDIIAAVADKVIVIENLYLTSDATGVFIFSEGTGVLQAGTGRVFSFPEVASGWAREDKGVAFAVIVVSGTANYRGFVKYRLENN